MNRFRCSNKPDTMLDTSTDLINVVNRNCSNRRSAMCRGLGPQVLQMHRGRTHCKKGQGNHDTTRYPNRGLQSTLPTGSHSHPSHDVCVGATVGTEPWMLAVTGNHANVLQHNPPPTRLGSNTPGENRRNQALFHLCCALPFFPPSAFLRRLRFWGKSRQAQNS